MNRPFLLTYNNVMPQEFVAARLNSSRAIKTWASPFPNAILVISDLTLSELTAVIGSHFGGIWFLLVELDNATVNGWLPNHFWTYVNDPHRAYSERIFADLAKYLPPPRTDAPESSD